MIFKFVKGLSNQYTKNPRSQLGDDDMKAKKRNLTCSTFFGLWGSLCFCGGNKRMSMMSILHTLNE